MTRNEVVKAFHERFGNEPVVVRSPGRVNLIGEHTDYNEGYVLPAAITKEVLFAIRENSTDTASLIALDLGKEFSFNVNTPERSSQGWPNYLAGVVDQLNKSGHEFSGFDCVFSSTIPVGAGLSSSAALECGLAYALNHIFSLNLETMDMVKLSQKAEHEFVGIKCGIMDQFASMFGKKDHAIKLDCRSLKYEYVPFEFKDYCLLLVNSMVEHELASSEYNTRRQECEKVVEGLRKHGNDIQSLRDVSFEMLETHTRYLDPVSYMRANYVLEENARVHRALEAMRTNDIDLLGSLMLASHRGLSKEYEVSCPELDFLVGLTLDIDGIAGARMMGGGFGGCTINLIHRQALDETQQYFLEKYNQAFNKTPEFYIADIGEGTSLL